MIPTKVQLKLLALFAVAFLLSACASNAPRPYYSRDAGAWVTPQSRSVEGKLSVPSISFHPSGSANAKLRKVAESYLGTPYRFGGQSHSGIDCSGFVGKVFQEALGVTLPRNSAFIARKGREVSRKKLQMGDLVFFRGFLFIDHVGIYMGDGYFIHSQSGIGVTYTLLNSAYFDSHFAVAKRLTD